MPSGCLDCGNPFPTNRGNVFFEVVGFEQKRAQGGTNAIRDRRRTGRWLCFACMTKRSSGISPGQGSFA